MTDKLLPLPEPFDHIQTLESTGATDDVPVFTADQVRTHREEYAQAVLSAHLAAQQAEPAPATDIDEAQIKLMTERGAKAWAGYEPAPVVGEPSEPLLRRMDAYLAGQSAEATAIIKDARAVLALRSQPVQAEPVAWMHVCRKKPKLRELLFTKHSLALASMGYKPVPLYLHPPSPTPQAVPMTDQWRLLNSGERIQAGDEALQDDCVTWVSLVGWEVGMAYNPHILVPMRRRAEARHGITQPQQEGGV